jgi:hypothetical protein
MTLTIHLPGEQQAALDAKARALGSSAGAFPERDLHDEVW